MRPRLDLPNRLTQPVGPATSHLELSTWSAGCTVAVSQHHHDAQLKGCASVRVSHCVALICLDPGPVTQKFFEWLHSIIFDTTTGSGTKQVSDVDDACVIMLIDIDK